MFSFLSISHYILLLNGIPLYGSSLFIHLNAGDNLRFSGFCYYDKTPVNICVHAFNAFIIIIITFKKPLYLLSGNVARKFPCLQSDGGRGSGIKPSASPCILVF